jgi:hypothetical protein
MLSKNDIESIASEYLLRNNYPIIGVGEVEFPEDRSNQEAVDHFKKNNLAVVSFISKYLDDPEHDLDPGVYIVYVNIITGQVHMPPHM